MVSLLTAGTALLTTAFLTADARERLVSAVSTYLPVFLQNIFHDPFAQTLIFVFALTVFCAVATWLGARIFIRPLDDLGSAARAVQAGEYSPVKFKRMTQRADEVGEIAKVFDEMARDVMARDRRLKLLRVLIPIGVALSAEKDFDQLLETIVIEAQNITNADGGSLYLTTSANELTFVIARNISLNLNLGGKTGAAMTFPPVPLTLADGQANHHNVASHVALTGKRVNIADAYASSEYDFSGTKAFDAKTGYRSTSFLAIPLKSDDEKVIGVLQLINAKDLRTGAVIAFPDDDVIDSLGLMTSAALTGYMREQDLRKEIQQLRIEIDHVKQQRQVEEITDTDFFKGLKAKADRIRAKKVEGGK